MTITPAQAKATSKYQAKTYDKILLRIRKDADGLTRDKIQQAADAAGESVNEYILKAVSNRISEETAKHTYLVATQEGGIMEDPQIRYTNQQVIKANSKEEAAQKYNAINNCSYYYGKVIKQLS